MNRPPLERTALDVVTLLRRVECFGLHLPAGLRSEGLPTVVTEEDVSVLEVSSHARSVWWHALRLHRTPAHLLSRLSDLRALGAVVPLWPTGQDWPTGGSQAVEGALCNGSRSWVAWSDTLGESELQRLADRLSLSPTEAARQIEPYLSILRTLPYIEPVLVSARKPTLLANLRSWLRLS